MVEFMNLDLKPGPFVKWAGGKGQLLSEFSKRLPPKFSTYFEPFLGGGAFFFHLCGRNLISKARVSDSNPDLINAFIVIRDSLPSLLGLLGQLQEHAKDEQYYYRVARPRFNSIGPTSSREEMVEKAALLLYLNKTCFNGLYRVNKRGEFNVPWGRYTNPRIFDPSNLETVSSLLRKRYVSITSHDFAEVEYEAQEDDFVYFDPPYSPLSATANFAEYTSSSFGKADQERLAELYHQLSSRGCHLMLSNSTRVRELFEGRGYRIDLVNATRAINSVGTRRGPVEEILVTNY